MDPLAPEAPRSAARLAAEAAFALPQRPTFAADTAVVVKHRRRRLPEVADLPVQHAGNLDLAHPEEHKPPRVFRISAPSPVPLAVGLNTTAQPREPAELAWSSGPEEPVPQARPARRRRRRAAEQRPGPLLQVFQAPVQTAPSIENLRESVAPAQAEIGAAAELRAQLAELDTILDGIRQAQAFEFTVEGDDVWLRLGRRAAAIAAQVQQDSGTGAPGVIDPRAGFRQTRHGHPNRLSA